MIFSLFLLFNLIPGLLASNAGFFDLVEYRRISYDASIGNDFLWFAKDVDIQKVSPANIDEFEQMIVEKIPKETHDHYMFVTSKGGQKFACSLPEVESLKKPNVPKSSKNPKVYGEVLAASFYVEKCIRMRGNHWWSYVLCRGQTVEQIHGEPEKDGYVKNTLGIFDGSLTMPPYAESTEDRLLYVEESYTSGTYCDLEDNREPRKTKVRYECESSLSTNEAYIESVVEIKPCQYLMTVKVSTLCSFPEFLPASQANTQTISCHPYLSRADVRGLLEKQLQEEKNRKELEMEQNLAKYRYRMATERFTAMTKGTRDNWAPDVIKRTNAEMDYKAAQFDLIVYNYKKTGETVTMEKIDALWTLISKADLADYMFYVDYETIDDENQGHLWYYFHDPTWPKDQFPKDVYLTAMQNEYQRDAGTKMQGKYVYDDQDGALVVAMERFWRTGRVDVENNVVITAMEIYEEIAEHEMASDEIPEWSKNIYRRFLYHGQEMFIELIELFAVPPSKRKPGVVLSVEKLFYETIPDIQAEIEYAVRETSMTGEKTFHSFEVRPVTKDSNVLSGAKYEIFINDEEDLFIELTNRLTKKLTPFFVFVTILYYQDFYNNYFHVWPPHIDHLERGSEDWEVHYFFAQRAHMIIDHVAGAAAFKIKQEVEMQYGAKRDPMTMEKFNRERRAYVASEKKRLDAMVSEEEYHDLVHDIMDQIFWIEGPAIVKQARNRLWDKRVEKYRMNYWMKDYKLRKEAKSLHGLMTSMLSTLESTSIHTIGGGKKSQKDSQTKSFNMDDYEKKMNEEARATIHEFGKKKREEEFDDGFDEMQDIMDLLGKAGLNKDVDVQIKLFDADGNEMLNDELDAIAKDLLDGVDAVNRFKKTEKAYSTKVSWNSEDDEEDKDEKGSHLE